MPQCVNLRTFTTYFPRDPSPRLVYEPRFEHSSNSNKSAIQPIVALSLFLSRQEIDRKIWSSCISTSLPESRERSRHETSDCAPVLPFKRINPQHAVLRDLKASTYWLNCSNITYNNTLDVCNKCNHLIWNISKIKFWYYLYSILWTHC